MNTSPATDQELFTRQALEGYYSGKSLNSITTEMALSEFQAKLQAVFLSHKADLAIDHDKIMFDFQSMEGDPSKLFSE
ncbi:hypothetical protein BGZ98_001230 [Dissophora globulifera]|nr:hypothetical protein BGZ98_001230 [Dissophora globulifera]